MYGGTLTQIQVVLTNGTESPIFAASDNGTLEEHQLKPEDDVKKIMVNSGALVL